MHILTTSWVTPTTETHLDKLWFRLGLCSPSSRAFVQRSLLTLERYIPSYQHIPHLLIRLWCSGITGQIVFSHNCLKDVNPPPTPLMVTPISLSPVSEGQFDWIGPLKSHSAHNGNDIILFHLLLGYSFRPSPRLLPLLITKWANLYPRWRICAGRRKRLQLSLHYLKDN